VVPVNVNGTTPVGVEVVGVSVRKTVWLAEIVGEDSWAVRLGGHIGRDSETKLVKFPSVLSVGASSS